MNLFDYYIQVQVRDNDKVFMHNKLNISYTYIVSILSHVFKLICVFVYMDLYNLFLTNKHHLLLVPK